ncbi:FkbM family methyltransferase [Amylibacter sp.]|jgi:FkbM family methyltransferase|nr:FkbM family methyltransferase [Amylibacter sp.]MDC1532077.1 FkbM family methyltransferase [Amylibacter sp.]
MKIFRLITNLFRLISLGTKISMGEILMLLEKAISEKPVIAFKKNNKASICGVENDFLFQQALSNGLSGNEPHFEKIVKLLVNSNSNTLDVGANIGTHSIILSHAATEGQVFSFEPQSLIYSLLQNNLLMNQCSNVTPYKFALAKTDNNVIAMESFSFNGEHINNGALRVDKSNISKGDLVLTRSLDSFNFPKIDFIKLDIQGAELDTLEGAEKLISKDRPVMFIEIEEHHLRALNASSKELIEKIFSLDYVLFRIETNYPCDHLCIPLESVEKFEEEVISNIPYYLTKLEGKKIELRFESDLAHNYESFKIID